MNKPPRVITRETVIATANALNVRGGDYYCGLSRDTERDRDAEAATPDCRWMVWKPKGQIAITFASESVEEFRLFPGYPFGGFVGPVPRGTILEFIEGDHDDLSAEEILTLLPFAPKTEAA